MIDGENIMKKYFQAVGIWALIIPIAILNGILREKVLITLENVALPLSGIILSISIFIVAYFFIPKINSSDKKDYIIIGIIWFILTNLFDLIMFLSDGGNLSDLLESYNFLDGNLWIIVVLTTLLSPIIVAKIKKLID